MADKAAGDQNITETTEKLAKTTLNVNDDKKAMIGSEQLNKWKFWSTQPVPNMDSDTTEAGIDGHAIDEIKTVEQIKQEPYKLPGGFEWCTLDVTEEAQLNELYDLLNMNYVEDEDEMFRFKYSKDFLNWAVMPPGYHKDWHVGVRVSKSQRLVGFVAGIPARVKIGSVSKDISEINFLCVHKSLQGKRVAVRLIQEVTRKINLKGIFQAVYTAGKELPKPISQARYYHRSLNVKKLLEIRFTALTKRQTVNRLVKLNKLPEKPQTPGFRRMTEADIPQAKVLVDNYLKNMKLAPDFDEADFKHWLLTKEGVVYSYVVENPETKKVTDFGSFYSLPSTVMTTDKHETLNACYSFYNVAQATGWKAFMEDMLISAKMENFDVYNALECMDNKEFLEDLKFGAGDGELKYYLYNWMVKDIEKEELALILL